MSVILAIDTSLSLTCCAVSVDGEIRASACSELARRQSSELPRQTERVMKGLTWSDLDYIALTTGPGYFTGLRIGASYASSLAYACGAKIIPVSTLDLLARSSGQYGKILAVIYSGHGYVYAQCSGYLEAGEYPLAQISSWTANNPDAIIISDNPERAEIQAQPVRPRIETLCALADSNLDAAISPLELRLTYYRLPQGVKTE